VTTTTAFEATQFVDHAEPVTTPQVGDPGPVRRRRKGRRPWTAWLAIVLLVGAAALGGRYLVAYRTASQARMSLDSAVLSATPIPIGSPSAAVVSQVGVSAGQIVTAGQTLAVVQSVEASSSIARQTVVLIAPSAGTILTVDHPQGSVVRPGDSVVTMYRSDQFTFVASVPVSDADRLRAGMAARVSGPGLSTPLLASVTRAQPNINGATPDRVSVVLTPGDTSATARLLPGLAYRADIELTSVGNQAHPIIGSGP
jgi:multidrug efflux pump subunit AcrA (membrane-fusion protein)